MDTHNNYPLEKDTINPYTGEPWKDLPPAVQVDDAEVSEAITEATKNSFEDHRGRPGQRGGSLPRDAGGADAAPDKEKAAQLSKGLIGQLKAGGFSQSIDGISPGSGYMTATSTQTEKKIALNQVSDASIQEYILDNYADLQKPDAYLGGWLDKDQESGEVFAYLDVSTNFQGLSDTIEIASQSNQIGVYDLSNNRTVYIDYENNKAPFFWEDESNKIGKTYIQ